MGDVTAGDVSVSFIVVVIGWAATFYLARKIHLKITGIHGRENKPRWFAANGAGIGFFLFGFLRMHAFIFEIATLVSGRANNLSEILEHVLVMVSFTAIGAIIGFGIGKIRP